jgi:protein-S-isoprenylcysteine O-methyltransferase Ste14
MQLFPMLKVGWLNGWVPLVGFYLVFGLLIWIFPKPVVSRLYDRTGWGRQHRIMTTFAKLIAVFLFMLMIFTPMKIREPIFILGMVIYALGFVGMVLALLDYRNTPMDQPVTRGLYRVSRNPQWVTVTLAFAGICLTIGSWIALISLGITVILGHSRILAEEKACLAQYGDSYKHYMNQVPRYFLF